MIQILRTLLQILGMADKIDNLLLEHLKKIQAAQSAARERDREMMTRLGQIETMIARIGRDDARLA